MIIKIYSDPCDPRLKLRFHGNGFLQAEAPDGCKVHMWHSECPRQKVNTPIHNHNHAFLSTVLVGALENREYEAKVCHKKFKGDAYRPHRAMTRRDKDTQLEAFGPFVRMRPTRYFYLPEGTVYKMPAWPGLYHETIPVRDMVITHVRRVGSPSGAEPIVMVPRGTKPDNEFDRYSFPEQAEMLYWDLRNNLLCAGLAEGVPPENGRDEA